MSLAEAKARLGVSGAGDDALIGALIEAATAHLDGWSGLARRCLVTQTWRQTFDGFAPVLRLPLPAASVTSVTYVDTAGTTRTVAAEVYALRQDALGSYVEEAPDGDWPSADDRAEAVTVTFTAGYGAADDVPGPIKEAIHVKIRQLYWGAKRGDGSLSVDRVDGVGLQEFDTTEAVGKAADRTIMSLISTYRRVGL